MRLAQGTDTPWLESLLLTLNLGKLLILSDSQRCSLENMEMMVHGVDMRVNWGDALEARGYVWATVITQEALATAVPPASAELHEEKEEMLWLDGAFV